MHIDITQHIGAVIREVSSRRHDGKDLRVVRVSRAYPTTPDDLWEAVTSAERLPRWFLPITGDLRLGGRYQLQGNAGGEILECEPPRHVKVTWEFGGAVSWLEVRIAPQGAGSTLTLEHAMAEDDHWKKFGAGATGVGWDLALVGLAMHTRDAASRETAIAADGMTWMGSENGKAFIRQSSEAWGAASMAAGDPTATAEARARETTAAYTGS